MPRRAVLTALVLALLLSSCAVQPPHSAPGGPGFFLGFLHGLICVFSLIGSIFWDIRVYAWPNSGGWYDFGFVLGAACFFAAKGGPGILSFKLTRR